MLLIIIDQGKCTFCDQPYPLIEIPGSASNFSQE